MPFDIKEFANKHSVEVTKVREYFKMGQSYVLENGDLVLPEEFDFYTDEYHEKYMDTKRPDWWAEDDFQGEIGMAGDEPINVTPSEWTEFAVMMPDKGVPKPFSFGGRRYLRTPYDIYAYRILLMCGRQVEKSTLVGNSILARMAIIPHYRALYVSPTHEQTKVFRRDRIGDPIALSEIYQNYISPKHANNMSIIKFVNYSQLVLRYAYLSADRVRGIPADAIYIDEIQDILTSNIPVIEECAGHANPELKTFIYSGTPKSHDNTIEHLWAKRSTQNEWAVPNDRQMIFDMKPGNAKERMSRYYWNAPLDEGNIGMEGLVCKKYGNPISAAHPDARWVSMNPKIREHATMEPFESFRVPQIMVPWIEWRDILDKYETYQRAKFFNEVLAISYDSGTRPLRMDDLIENSLPHIQMNAPLESIRRAVGGTRVFMGIDWGCHDDQTRILTQDGFKYFEDLSDEDKVAQFDPETRAMSFVSPKVVTVRDWDKPLLHFKTKNMDMMLTHTHRMLTTVAGRDSWVVESAGETAERGGNVKFRGYVEWEGEEVDEFVLPGVPKSAGYSGSSDVVFSMDGWLEFLGYMLTEGGVCLKDGKPYMLKMSQRETVNLYKTQKMRNCMDCIGIPYTEHFNENTGDVNWSICGKQYWKWVSEECGILPSEKRVPRQFLSLSTRQLQILFDALVDGDGSRDHRDPRRGAFYSTSKGLCEDFQEICIRLGIRAAVSLHKEAEGNRKTRWRVTWSPGKDLQLNTPKKKVEHVPYSGKVYCCAVPTGFIVTERNGKVAYQGNTGENTYTVVTLGAYLSGIGQNEKFTTFYFKRYTGIELDPEVQLDDIHKLVSLFRPALIGVDYGGGFDRNKKLINRYGPQRVIRYQYIGGHGGGKRPKLLYDTKKGRYLVDRTEVMSDMFNAIKEGKMGFPRWEDWQDPYGMDFLSIFSEYNETTRMTQYDKSPDVTDDAFHATLYSFFASMVIHPRPDIIRPTYEPGSM